MKVLVVSGSSGGHIFPALGFIDTLKDREEDLDALLVLPKKSVINHSQIPTCQINYISISPIKLSLDLRNFVAIFNFFKGSLESLLIILKFKPDLVVGFGSIVSIPIIFFAWSFGIKTLLHEQNVIPGRATKLLVKFADKLAVSFAKTQDYFRGCQKKIVFTGNPIRKELIRIEKKEALAFFGFHNDKMTLLVTGGSLGSHKINTEFFKAISTMNEKRNIQVIHLAGQKDYESLRLNYKGVHVEVKLFSFLRSMQYAYSASDLVICRAGATTITEIQSFGLPAIIVPYPYAYKHQLNNALVLKKMGTAIIIEDHELDAGMLRQVISELINHPEKISAMRSRYHNILKPSANDLLVDAALFLYNN